MGSGPILNELILGGVAALALVASDNTSPRGAYLQDWGIADMRRAVVASGSVVVSEDDSGDPIIAGRTPSGLRFTVSGRVCEGRQGARRCRGAFVQSSFELEDEEEVDAAVREWAPKFAAVAISNDGEHGVMISRYLIFDYGMHRDNLRLNLEVFTGIAEEVRGGLGGDVQQPDYSPAADTVRVASAEMVQAG